MKVSRFQLIFSAKEKIIFTQFPGSALRGVFGNAFKALSCLTGREQCQGCTQKTQCAFTQVFKTTQLTRQRLDDVPQPLIFDMSEVPQVIRSGESFSIYINLISDSVYFINELIQAWEFAGQLGLDSQGKKVTFQLIAAQEVDISMPTLISNSKSILMDLITPHRAFRREGNKRKKQLITPDKFIINTYLANIVRRYTNLQNLYDTPFPKEESQALLNASYALEGTTQSLTLSKQYRISGKQNKKLDFSGIKGQLSIKGDLLPSLLPILWEGQWLHVGNSPMYGLGRYRITGVTHV